MNNQNRKWKGISQNFYGFSCYILLSAMLAGCTANMPFVAEEPTQTTYVYSDSYDRVWATVTGVLHADGLSLEVIDKDSGVLSGVKRLEPSTIDMLMNYSARVATSVSVQNLGNGVQVSINSTNERKHEEHDWRPAGEADKYSATLFEALNKQLNQNNRPTANVQRSDVGSNSIDSARSATASMSSDRQRIQKVQSVLNDLGYSAGIEDGIMGKNTSAAIQSFQQDNGLDPTGQLDEITVEALSEAWLKH